MFAFLALRLLFVGGMSLTITGYLGDHHIGFALGAVMFALSVIVLIAIIAKKVIRNGGS